MNNEDVEVLETNGKGSSNNNNIKILLILLVIIVVGLGAYIFFENSRLSKVNNEKASETVKKYNVDESIEKDLLSKVNSVINGDVKGEEKDFENGSKNYTAFNFYGANNIFRNAYLSDEQKLYIALNNSNSSKITIAKENIGNADFKEDYGYYADIDMGDDTSRFSQINLSDVEDQYKKLFNGVPTYTDIYDCPFFYYDAVNKVYYKNASCSNYANSILYTYVNDIKLEDNNAYVNVNVGYYEVNPESLDGDETKYDIRSDFDKEKTYKTGLTMDEVTNFKITSSNYKSFSEYKFIFEKDDNNNYYLTYVERID